MTDLLQLRLDKNKKKKNSKGHKPTDMWLEKSKQKGQEAVIRHWINTCFIRF